MNKRNLIFLILSSAVVLLVMILAVIALARIFEPAINPHAQVEGCDPHEPRSLTLPTGVHTAVACPALVSIENMDASGDKYKITIYPVKK